MVVFNDMNKNAYGIIKKNLAKLKEDREVFNLPYEKCLENLKDREFDYIYCDPPYAFGKYEELFGYVRQYGILAQKGIMVIETRKDVDLANSYEDMESYKEKRYGIVKLLYYRKRENI